MLLINLSQCLVELLLINSDTFQCLDIFPNVALSPSLIHQLESLQGRLNQPVSFFVDPDMLKDRSARSITQITLSYTFYPVKEKQAAVGDKPVGAPKKSGS